MYIVDAALDDTALQGIVSTLEQHVQNHGGEIVATREFGRRRLAYEIDKHTSGTYMITYFKSHGDVVEEVYHEMHLIEGIVRGIVVVANPKAIFDPQAPEPEAAAPEGEPDMALAEATTEGVSTGEAGVAPPAEAEPEAEAESEPEAAPEPEAVAGEEAAAEEDSTEEA